MNQDVKMGLFNLHDAFLNASLQQRLMMPQPVETNPNLFHMSDRARLERTWIMFLSVLCESWKSAQMKQVRDFVSTVVSVAELEDLIKTGDQVGSLSGMFQTRSYMCHRDKREYWNEGRTAVIGKLNFHMKLHDAFSKVLLAAMRHVNGQSGDAA